MGRKSIRWLWTDLPQHWLLFPSPSPSTALRKHISPQKGVLVPWGRGRAVTSPPLHT